jgi:hypothetical protein
VRTLKLLAGFDVRILFEDSKIRPLFFLSKPGFLKKWLELRREYGRKPGVKPTFCGFLPTFENGFGHEKPSAYAGLRAFCPLSPLLFSIKCDKKIKHIEK